MICGSLESMIPLVGHYDIALIITMTDLVDMPVLLNGAVPFFGDQSIKRVSSIQCRHNT